MEIWNYTKNAKVETIYPITIWGTFVSSINSWRKELAAARKTASDLTYELILAKADLTDAFQQEPHSERVKTLKRKYHLIKEKWKRKTGA